MGCQFFGRVLYTSVIGIMFGWATPSCLADGDSATQPSDLTVAQIIAAVVQTEHQFQNVHVKDFNVTTETRSGNEGNWNPSKMRFSGSAWFDADPVGKERVYLSHEVLPWTREGRPTSWSDGSREMSWDTTKLIELRLGRPGSRFNPRLATVTGDRTFSSLSPYMRDWTGVGFTAQYFVTPEEGTLPPKPRQAVSSFLTDWLKSGAVASVAKEMVNGFDTVRLRFEHKLVRWSWWFDPSRDYSLVKTERIMRLNPDVIEGVDVLEFKRAAPNIWYPIHATIVMRDVEQPEGYNRFTFRAGDVIVNDPTFDADVFHIQIPTGWIVDNNSVNPAVSYMMMPDGSNHPLKQGDALPSVKAVPATRPE